MPRNINKFILLLLQIVFFCFVYMFLNDSHFSGINTLEEMIRKEVLQRKIDPIIEKTDPGVENFEVSNKKIKEKTKAIKTQLNNQDVLENMTTPTFFDSFFKRLYFSFVTGTTLGYGDIFPNSTICKTLTILQLTSTALLFIV